jgi:hypothetical protein
MKRKYLILAAIVLVAAITIMRPMVVKPGPDDPPVIFYTIMNLFR